jgi:hypothetical protein
MHPSFPSFPVVPYTLKQFMSPCHIHFDVIQRSQGCTALARQAYQDCARFDDGFRRANYRRYAGFRIGGVALLPEGALAMFADMGNFLMATAFRKSVGTLKRAGSLILLFRGRSRGRCY